MLTAVPVIVMVFWVAIMLDAAIHYGSDWRLSAIDPQRDRSDWPLVSIVAAARNEERAVAAAVDSLLKLDYPNVELVVVNDRSTDRTGDILAAIAQRDPHLRVVNVTELPPHWLGKNHALELGAEAARGEYLLFTDADVMLEATTLRRAVVAMETRGLDHLACAPEMVGGTRPLQMFVASFAVFFSLYARPWRAKNPKSSAHVGVGAFNLVRTAKYREIGGHTKIAMRPDDDMKLGKLVKMSGGRQQFFSGEGFVRVEWYATLREAIEGLMKNSFSGVDYSFVLLVLATISQFIFSVSPFLMMFLTSGSAFYANVAAAVMIVSIATMFSVRSGLSWVYGFTFPVSAMIMLYILWKAAIRTVREGGIRWRDTLYPLDELKANKV